MSNKDETLEGVLHGIFDYCEGRELATLHGYWVGETTLPLILWKSASDWRPFIESAKQAGAKLMIVESTEISVEDLKELRAKLAEIRSRPNGSGLPAEKLRYINEIVTELPLLERRVGKIGGIKLSWFKQDVRQDFVMTTGWFNRFLKLAFESTPCALKVKKSRTAAPSRVPYAQ